MSKASKYNGRAVRTERIELRVTPDFKRVLKRTVDIHKYRGSNLWSGSDILSKALAYYIISRDPFVWTLMSEKDRKKVQDLAEHS